MTSQTQQQQSTPAPVTADNRFHPYTNTERDAIPAPASSQIIYNADEQEMQAYVNGAWVNVPLPVCLAGAFVSQHDHDGDYAPKMHDAASDYAAKAHDHDDDYAPKMHDAASDYAAKAHDHDDDYAPKMHDAASDYAAKAHDHDDDYAAKMHDHDDDYAPKMHDAASDYAAKDHTHPEPTEDHTHEDVPEHRHNYASKTHSHGAADLPATPPAHSHPEYALAGTVTAQHGESTISWRKEGHGANNKTHGLSRTPVSFDITLKCTTAHRGWAVGDIFHASGHDFGLYIYGANSTNYDWCVGDGASPVTASYADFPNSGLGPLLPDRDGNGEVKAHPDNWDLVVIAR